MKEKVKFAFFFPAKIVFSEMEVDFSDSFIFEGFEFFLSDKRIFFDTKKEKIVCSELDFNEKQIFIKIKQCYGELRTCRTENVSELLKSLMDGIKKQMPKWENDIENPLEYERRASGVREKIKAEREALDREQEERKKRWAEAAQKVYEKSLQDFKNGESIDFKTFERACQENNIKIPKRTLGFGRKNIKTIGLKGYSGYTNHSSNVLWETILELNSKL